LQNFVKNGSSHGTKTMAGHFLFLETHAPKAESTPLLLIGRLESSGWEYIFARSC
jgi:hypothetical protein